MLDLHKCSNEELIELYKQNLSTRKIASILHKARNTVEKEFHRRNIDIQELSKHFKSRYCLLCGTKLRKGQYKFCCSSHSATYNNLHRERDVNKCIYCGKIINKKNKFCSIKCQRKYDTDCYIENWKKGKENGLNGKYGISIRIKKYLLDKYNNKCQICGWSSFNKFTNKIPLEVHHIDGNYMNNKEENLQLLCPNCHSLTENYKNHNKSGRKDRSKYLPH